MAEMADSRNKTGTLEDDSGASYSARKSALQKQNKIT